MFLDERIEKAIPQGGSAVWKVIQEELRVGRTQGAEPLDTLKRIANTWKLVLKNHPELKPNWLHNVVVRIITETGATEQQIKILSNIFRI